MPRKNASHYGVVGCELLKSEINVLESIAQSRGIRRSQVVKDLVRDFLSTHDGVAGHNPIANIRSVVE